MSKINPLDILAVKNVISRYCEALDTKDFAVLEKVFVPDVIADYPFNSNLEGAKAVAKAIQNRY
jgi:ketosteroid isomerase-like protein